ncbi:STAS domain-containing protein, partial [Actinomadura viridis]|uniref:STAS domain-containing protein n=1 Tax=Actinomadura viridis TaxID=58110 RepID=UPI0031E862C7
MAGNQKAHQPDRLSVEREVVDGVRVVIVRGEIDHDVKDVLSEALLSADGTVLPQRIVADLSGVTFLDSSGTNVFLQVLERADAAQGWLRLAAVQAPVMRVLHLVGLDPGRAC